MITSGTVLKWRIDHLWPQADVDLADNEKWIPSVTDFDRFVKYNWVRKCRYISEIFDCDKYALLFHATAVLYIADLVWAGVVEAKDVRPWAVGEAWGTKFRNVETNHAVNIVFLQEGLINFNMYLYEPQNGEMWIPNNLSDMVYDVRI
uniref:Agglutinin C-terminal domain-containing protein n=1 Tax=viral metagenome TaxID=1070528 RepID=A0A6M3JAA2_9ZZZZ